MELIEFKNLLHSARLSGNMYLQYDVGIAFKLGNGVEKSLDGAVEWFKRSAEQGFAEAQLMLGLMYVCGEGCKQDYNEAIWWLKCAAKQGKQEAETKLKDLKQAGIDFSLYEKLTVDIHDFTFKSTNCSRHFRKHHYWGANEPTIIEAGESVSNHIIKIEDNIFGEEGYSVTIYEVDEKSDNVIMPPLPMRPISVLPTVIRMEGWGMISDTRDSNSKYSLTIHYTGTIVEEVVIHIYDLYKYTDIIYKS